LPVRIDYRMIQEHVRQGARVLDLGCGDGTLLAELFERKDVKGYGIEIDEEQVRACISKGVPVYHGDMLEGMDMFAEKNFDCVILSHTLQQTLRPEEVIREMLRVGEYGIISFPNFGLWQVRCRLLLTGKMPVKKVLPYSWFDSPIIHLLTIKDFEKYCAHRNIQIIDRIFLSSSYSKVPRLLANIMAGIAIYVVKSGS